MNVRECSEYLAHQVCRNADSGISLTPNVWMELFHDCIQQVVASEHQQILAELTNLAVDEKDSTRRACYFKAARMLNDRMPIKAQKLEV